MDATFTKFGKLTPGNDCPGSDILVGGVRIGELTRIIDWIDVGSVSVSYKAKITGYKVMIYAVEEEPEFKTLAEARAYAREYVRKVNDKAL